MPYLTLGSFTNGSQKESYHHESNANGPEGLDESIKSRNSRRVTHVPMTLDQYYYPVLEDTSVRDGDQVLSKFLQNNSDHGKDQLAITNAKTRSKAGSSNSGEKQILMVDQLWMWIVDEGATTIAGMY
jgi:hypothetical protein